MNCAGRKRVYALYFVLSICAPFYAATAKSAKEGGSMTTASGATAEASAPTAIAFQWKEHNKLSWDDFQGPVNATNAESAAATHCSMGFKTNFQNAEQKPEVIVYNKFYINKSWVRSDAKISTILVHEQGHFDLCELYTRELKKRLDNFNFTMATNAKQQLYDIYVEVNREYETRQAAYEHETLHGTNLRVQKQWAKTIAMELQATALVAY